MRIFAHWTDFPSELRGGAWALGSFDGVHRAHCEVIARARALADPSAAGPSAKVGVLCFEPPTRRFFRPDAPPFRLTTPLTRARALAAIGVDWLIEAPFDATIAAMSDEAFIRAAVVEGIGARAVTAGFDFRFGRQRMGDAARLAALGAIHGFEVGVEPQIGDEAGDKISATGIREALAEGDLDHANFLLGRPWAMEGVVVQGEQRGRLLGFPTANLAPGDQLWPKMGVYAVRVESLGSDGTTKLVRPGVANFGRTPTTGERQPLLEAHLFDFDGDLYGARIVVELVKFLRPELRFDGLDALKARIARDCAEARRVLGISP